MPTSHTAPLAPDRHPAALIPNLRHRDRMLADLGLQSIDELFADIPHEVHIDGLELDAPMSEQDVVARHARMASRNLGPRQDGTGMPVFLGAGLKEHYVPATVRALVGRSEFYTSYTPYQPEVSQGMLQALFEFQSLVTALTGTEVANVSQYDWATAIGEAALMAVRAHKGQRFLIPEAITPEKREVLANYLGGTKTHIQTIPFDRDTGTLDMAALDAALGPDVVGLYLETPNLFGLFEPEAPKIKALLDAHDAGPFIVGADPFSLALARGPGEYGADIVVGELAGCGVAPSYGGPLVGLLATNKTLVRKMPGRLVGLTSDDDGKHGFTLTLQAREQHIRRARAMSNICTNQTLAAVAATVFLSLTGGAGLADLACRNAERARTLHQRLTELPGVQSAFDGGHFDEFTLRFDDHYPKIHTALLAHNVHGGYGLAGVADDLANASVFATTEVHSDTDHEHLFTALREVTA